MEDNRISVLKDAAKAIGSLSFVEELNMLENRSSSTDTPMMLPLVGEFSSGKTTLINALTNSKALETATKPTTATIFEIHFGAPENSADVSMENGETKRVSDISSLKNTELADAKVVTVFDTSTKVSPFTILVDTPGISSSDPRHQQTLVDFLPQADSILIVVDVQQQMTKSLTNFLKSASLSGIELNAILTKVDTKSQTEIEAAKKYLEENSELPIKNVVAVSSYNNDMGELSELLKDLEMRKAEILKKSTELRLKRISAQILATIEDMLNASQDDSKLESAIQEQKVKLSKIRRQIERFISSAQSEIEELTRQSSRKFEDQVSTRLSSLINGKSTNYDNEAVSAINSIASIILGEYRQKIMRFLSDEANKPARDGEISLGDIAGIDFSSIGIQGLSYNLDLNNMGHEHDKWIKGGIIAVAAAATAAAVVYTGGGAAAAAEGLMTVDTVVDVADTVTDVSSMVSNRNLVQRMESAVKYGQQTASNIENVNAQGIGQGETGKGMIDSLAGFIAENMMSKPQRSRAIRQYIDGTLAPEFKMQLKQAENQVIDTIKAVLTESAKNSIDETTASLQKLLDEMHNNKAAFEQSKSELRALRTKILTL